MSRRVRPQGGWGLGCLTRWCAGSRPPATWSIGALTAPFTLVDPGDRGWWARIDDELRAGSSNALEQAIADRWPQPTAPPDRWRPLIERRRALDRRLTTTA